MRAVVEQPALVVLGMVRYLLGDCSGVCVGVDQIEQVEDVWTEVEFVVVV